MIRDKIHALRSSWVNRAGGFYPFYTLGAVSYLDAPMGNEHAYKDKANVQNALLRANYPTLYDLLQTRLSEILEMPVNYAKGLALPGFHIFLSHKAFEQSLAIPHFDIQYKDLTWNYQKVDKTEPFSFTCAVAVPSSPVGLNYWDITLEDKKRLSSEEYQALARPEKAKFMPYELGKLVIHRGLILHQIAAGINLQPTDERITLQGHGLICDGVLQLYW